ncbi:MAG: ribonuclease HII [Pseudomonadota bacterium]
MPPSTAYIAGVDEAGRGPLAGAVFAAAVILDPHQPIAGLKDSKCLSARKRETLYQQITETALSYSIAYADVAEIDQLNILQASLLAMRRAIDGLTVAIEKVIVDGIHCPESPYTTEAIIKGDQKYPVISAASILAKVSRDREMIKLDKQFPQYGFAKHKGYPTKAHLMALKSHGACAEHRLSFAPVKCCLV